MTAFEKLLLFDTLVMTINIPFFLKVTVQEEKTWFSGFSFDLNPFVLLDYNVFIT